MRILVSCLCLAFVSCKMESRDFKIMEDNKEDMAKMKLMTLSKAAKHYAIKNDGKPPASLADVTQYVDGDASDMTTDPWGKEFKFDAKGPKNGGKIPDIWTETGRKKVIGNWDYN